MSVLALVLFILTYCLMIALPKFRPWVALSSAALYVILGFVSPAGLGDAIDWNVLMMLSGTMGTVSLFIESRMPNRMAEVLLTKTPNVMWVAVAMSLFAGEQAHGHRHPHDVWRLGEQYLRHPIGHARLDEQAHRAHGTGQHHQHVPVYGVTQPGGGHEAQYHIQRRAGQGHPWPEFGQRDHQAVGEDEQDQGQYGHKQTPSVIKKDFYRMTGRGKSLVSEQSSAAARVPWDRTDEPPDADNIPAQTTPSYSSYYSPSRTDMSRIMARRSLQRQVPLPYPAQPAAHKAQRPA